MASRNDAEGLRAYKREWARANRARLAQSLHQAQQRYRSKPEVRARLSRYSHSYLQAHYIPHPKAPAQPKPAPLPPIPELWPYGHTGWPLDLVNAVVPINIPEPVRADTCQELCLALLTNELDEVSLPHAVKRVLRQAYGTWALSLYWRREDGLALGDRLTYLDDGT